MAEGAMSRNLGRGTLTGLVLEMTTRMAAGVAEALPALSDMERFVSTETVDAELQINKMPLLRDDGERRTCSHQNEFKCRMLHL